jgi:error-prone DNA polymerase
VGLNYVKGLRQSSARALVQSREQEGTFASVEDITARISELSRKELVALARIGALNPLERIRHRRDALWQVEEAGRFAGPLLHGNDVRPLTERLPAPLRQMTTDERLAADYAGSGLTTGPHPMAYHRSSLRQQGILSSQDLLQKIHLSRVRIAGCVIARQRPGTAKGFVFLSLEDEAGIANIIITPDVFEQNRVVVTRGKVLLIEGQLQVNDGVIHVKAQQIAPLELTDADIRSRDFH